MRAAKEIIVSLAFLCLYLPLSTIFSYDMGMNKLGLIVMLILGLFAVTIYLLIALLCYELRRPRYFARTKIRLRARPVFQIEKHAEEEPPEVIGFKRLFSDEKSDGGETE